MTNTTSPPAWDAIVIANQLQTIAGQSQSLMQRFLSRQPAAGKIGMGDASTVGSAFLELMTKMMSDPVAVANAQIGLFNEGMTVWRHAAERIFLMQESLVEPARDKRFKHPDWTENAMFSFSSAKATSSPRSRFCLRYATSRGSILRPRERWIFTRVNSSTGCRPPISSPPIRKC
jgi:hypothetical protein